MNQSTPSAAGEHVAFAQRQHRHALVLEGLRQTAQCFADLGLDVHVRPPEN
jgi:hypothetical protein